MTSKRKTLKQNLNEMKQHIESRFKASCEVKSCILSFQKDGVLFVIDKANDTWFKLECYSADSMLLDRPFISKLVGCKAYDTVDAVIEKATESGWTE